MPSKDISSFAQETSARCSNEVEPINISFVHPSLQTISNLCRGANENRPIASDTDMLSDRVLGPLRVSRREASVALYS